MLDALESMNKIPDTTEERVIAYVQNFIQKLSKKEIEKLSRYALKYRPKTKAVLGALLELVGYEKDAKKLEETLNSLSSYKVGVSEKRLPNKKKWKII